MIAVRGDARAALDELGVAEIPSLLTDEQCAGITAALDEMDADRPGDRNMLDRPWCRDFTAVLQAHGEIRPLLPARATAVQCTLFDKSGERNWLVALHQDLSIPVRERTAHPGCTGWSEKDGVLYVHPPAPVLESLVAVRVHLDDCGPESGPLRVVVRSHRHGRLSPDAARRLRERDGEITCIARRGDALAMRPLLLHASSRARRPARRRVLHVLVGPAELPFGLTWHRAP